MPVEDAPARSPGPFGLIHGEIGAGQQVGQITAAGRALVKKATVTLPAGVQYAWPHASRRYLYVATSSSASGYGAAGTEHHVSAFRIDPASGALTPHGDGKLCVSVGVSMPPRVNE